MTTHNSYLNAGQPNLSYFASGSGTFKVLVLFVDFPDAPAQAAPDTLYADNEFGDATQWFQQTSQGQMNMQFNPVDRWFRINQPSTDFQPNGGYMSGGQLVSLVQAAMSAASAGGVSFGGYQQVFVVDSPTSAIRSDLTSIAGPNAPVSAPDGTPFRWVTNFGATASGTNILTARDIEHELMHSFGPADLGNSSVGPYWTINYAAGLLPASLTAWERLQVGWLGLDHVDCVTSSGSTDVKLMPLEQGAGTRAIIIPVNGHYVVAENREMKNEDANICRPGMLLSSVNPQDDELTSSAISGIADPGEPVTTLPVSHQPDGCNYAWDMNGSKTYSDPSGNFQLRLLCHQTDLSYIVRVADGEPMSNSPSPLCKGAPPGEKVVQGGGGNGDHAKFTAKVASGRCSGSPKLRVKGSVTNQIPGDVYRLQEKLPASSRWLTVNKALGIGFTGGFQVTLTLQKVTCKTRSVQLRIASDGHAISRTVTLRITSPQHR